MMEATMGMTREQTLKEKTTAKLEKIFAKMACKDPRKAIHGTAAAAALVIAALPIGIDAWALRLCEIYMLISIYGHYGIKLSKSVAESLMSAAFMQFVGEAVAITALEAADAAAVATGGLGTGPAYVIKLGVATTLIESVGWATVKYLEGNKLAGTLIHIAEGIGVAGDIQRVAGALVGADSTKVPATNTAEATAIEAVPMEATAIGATAMEAPKAAGQVSFCGKSKELIESITKSIKAVENKIDSAQRKLDQIGKFIESDIRFGRDPSRHFIEQKYWLNQLDSLMRERSRLASKL